LQRPRQAPWTPYGRVYVLRLGHRPGRDKRITTHVALVARAFGANGFLLAGVCDPSVERSLKRTVECWGGSIEYQCGVPAKAIVKKWREEGGQVIHLTMYGQHVDDVIDEIRMAPVPKLIVVGAEKVDRFFYENADYNVSIGLQPHSEVAALALFLDRLYRGRQLKLDFYGARKRIIPDPHGKTVVGSGEC